MSSMTTAFTATPYAGHAIAFTTFGAEHRSVWRQRLAVSAGIISMPDQRGTADFLKADFPKTLSATGNGTAVKPGRPPRGVPR